MPSDLSRTLLIRRKKRIAFKLFFEWFRDIAIFNEAKDSLKPLFLNIDRITDMAKHNSVLTEGQLNSIMEIIKNTLKQTRYNIGIKITIDGMLLKIAEVSLYNGKDGWSKV